MPIKIQKNIPLAKYTTFKIGGPAKHFCAAKNTDEMKEAFEFAEKNKLKVFILGGGSNLLVSDEGFDGLVIKIQNSKFKIQNSNIICGAGLALAKIVSESIKNSLTGLEWAVGIPGTVGGAVCNNVGAFGKSMSDVVEEVEVLDVAQKGSTVPRRELWSQHTIEKLGKWKLENSIPPLKKGARGISGHSSKKNGNWEIGKLNNEQCQFSYRNSIFKKEKKYIIVSAVLKLEKGNKEESKRIVAEYLKSRAEKQPLQYPSAGSIFRNPVIDEKHFKSLIKKYPELESVIIKKDPTLLKGIESLSAVSKYIIPAGWLIEELGLKGKKIGGAMVSDKHGNFIINIGNGKAENVVILISLIKQKARNNFGIQLNEEIEYVGF